MRSRLVIAALAFAVSGVVAAGSSTATATVPPDNTMPGETVPGETAPGESVPGGTVPRGEIVATGEWEIVEPGGECRCAHGTDYAFFVRPADPTKVVFFLEGGGSCFSGETCALGSTFYDADVDETDDPNLQRGIFDFNELANPFLGYSFVYVPYCTGDVHLGDKTSEYGDLTIQHKGWVNGTAARDYLAENFPDADQVVVVGESAGSIAAPVYAGEIADDFPEAQITVFADGSGAYPDDPVLNAGTGALWGTFETMPDWPVNADLTPEDWGIPRFVVQAGLHDPDIVMSRFDYAFDEVQTLFIDAVGGDTTDLLGLIDSNEAAIEDAGVNQHSYTAPGDGHTLVRKPDFYTMEVNGVALLDWVTALIAGEPSDDVHCEECDAP